VGRGQAIGKSRAPTGVLDPRRQGEDGDDWVKMRIGGFDWLIGVDLSLGFDYHSDRNE
jgi:hypothetical protein